MLPTAIFYGMQLLLADNLDADATMLSGGSGTNIDKLVRNGTNGCTPVFPNQIPYVNNIFAVSVCAVKCTVPYAQSLSNDLLVWLVVIWYSSENLPMSFSSE